MPDLALRDTQGLLLVVFMKSQEMTEWVANNAIFVPFASRKFDPLLIVIVCGNKNGIALIGNALAAFRIFAGGRPVTNLLRVMLILDSLVRIITRPTFDYF